MQPNRNITDWQQPNEQPSQAPYVPHADENQNTPIVTMSPDEVSRNDTSWSAGDTPPTPQDPGTDPQPPQEPRDGSVVRWRAVEYIHRDKSALWYSIFATISLVLTAGAIYFGEITFAILVPVMAAALFMYTRRPPRVLDYTLSREGLYVNDHLNSFADFKSFGVVHDGDEYSVMLIPVKRFKPGVSVYFPEESGEAIVDMLGARLPMEELHLDIVDKIIRQLRI